MVSCNYENIGRCMHPQRMDDECDTRCPLYGVVEIPKNASHDPSRFAAWIKTKLMKLKGRQKHGKHAQH